VAADVTGVRTYDVRAVSSGTFGRVLLSARDQHLVVDGPAQNGCPGEAVTPAELFLGGVVTCGVELVEVIARERGVALAGVRAVIHGEMDPSRRVRQDVNLFSSVTLEFELAGVGDEDAAALVEAFKSR
jgi:uncharacterized OsmC-like protein